MKTKVKIFDELTIKDLEEKINEFLSKNLIYKVEDIKFNIYGESYLNSFYSAMIIYKEVL